MRIRFKLISGFGIIVFLVIIIGVFTFIQTTQIHHEFDVVEKETTPAIIALANIKSNIFFVTLEANEYILDPVEEHLEELQEGKEKLAEAILAYEKAETEEEEEVEQIKRGITKITSSIDEIINLKDSGASMDILLEKSKMLDEVIEEFSHELEKEIERDTLQLAESHQAVSGQIQVTNNLTIIIIVIIVILSIIVTWIFSTSISKSIINLRNVTKEITRGNLSARTKVEGNDELSQLASDVNVMADSLSQQKEELIKNEKISALGHVTSRLAHNLKNPLSVIKAATSIIESTSPDSVDKKTQERLNLIKTSIENMLNQIEDILDFVKQKPLELKDIPLSEILNTAINNIKKPKGIKINLPEKDIMIKCDEAKLQVVFMNMITNSIEAVEGNGEITIVSFQNARETIIEITDTGKGIPPDELGKIFDALYTTKPTGTGLGLPYCKSVIEQHGGGIEVSRDPTKFTIIIPRRIPS